MCPKGCLTQSNVNPICSVALAFGKKISTLYMQNHPYFRFTGISLLCQRESLRADAVVPIPHAGIFLANCWSEHRAEPEWQAFGCKKYNSSMFDVSNNLDIRYSHAREKLGKVANDSMYKNVFLIDEAIISGVSMKTAILTLKDYGVEQIFVRTLLPPFVKKCPYSIVNYTPIFNCNQDIAEYFGVDDYSSLTVEELLSINKSTPLCVECIMQ